MWRIVFLFAAIAGLKAGGSGQAAKAEQKADTQVEAAAALVGRSLFLRGLPAGDELSYDASGRMRRTEEQVDWTLAGIDVKRATRKGAEVEIEGVRVAIRYNQENRQFERHPQNEETIKVWVADAGNEPGFLAALDAIFSQGIDPRLQHETPPFWRHYFDPGLAWPADGLTVLDGGSPAAKDVMPPLPTHKADARANNGHVERDKVRGAVQLRIVVDADGVPRRVAIARPLGYGQDERAVESMTRWRFTPAMKDGKPVAIALVVNYDFQ